MPRWKHISRGLPDDMVAVQATQGFEVYAAKYDSQEDAWFELRIGGFATEVFPHYWKPMSDPPGE